MHNDFVIVGPRADPVGLRGMKDAAAALKKVAEGKAPFASRADDSGTYRKEMDLWRQAGVDPTGASGTWYRETGSGMGATLNTAVGMGAYALTDRGTWISFKNTGDLQTLVEGDPRLFNPYGVILVSPERHPRVKAELGQRFIDWLVGPEGQAAIAGFKLDGEPLFFPSAEK
jgi:tungstate transport system substrate-binding protein